jgi:hypothetical protein
MRTSTDIDKISTAIAAIQAAVPFVDKAATADQGSYTVKYAPHDLVWEKVRGHCAENNVAVIQVGREGAGASKWLVTRLVHTPSGQWIEGDVPVESAKAGMQGLGAVWSYARRIGLLAILGVVPKGEDSDAGDDHAGRSAKPPRVERSARPAGVPEDALALVEKVLADLPRLTTETQIDEASRVVTGIVPKEMTGRVRKAFNDARERVRAAFREPAAT